MNYYERHLGDYAKDTGHLSMLEHGAYTLLLDRYYATETGIPDDQKYRVARARSKDEKEAVDVVLSEFFQLSEGAWIKNRCQEEIEKAQRRIGSARSNGGKGGRPKKNRGETQLKPNGFPMGSVCETQSKALHTPDSIHQTPERNSLREDHEAFERVKAAYPQFPGRQNWIQVELHCKNRIDEGANWEQLEQGAKRYAAFIAATGQHVLSPVNFFGAVDQPWSQPWDIPPPKTQPSKFAKPSPGEIVQHGDRERTDIEKLMARREAIGIGGFRDPLPKETASEYRLAQDAEWTRRKAVSSALPPASAAGKFESVLKAMP